MRLQPVLVGLIGFSLSGLLAVLVAWTSFWIFSRTTRNIDELLELKANNNGVGILAASVLIANGLVMKQVLYPWVGCIRHAMRMGISLESGLQVLRFGLMYLILCQVASILAIVAGIRLFTFLTRGLDEFAEIRRNNTAVALTLGAVVVILGMFLAEGLQGLLASLVPSPFPDVIRTMGM
jgi:uncharacterized membrane protein YjfL (UPF0719 family)